MPYNYKAGFNPHPSDAGKKRPSKLDQINTIIYQFLPPGGSMGPRYDVYKW
jgi:hypothetical protein